MTSQINFKLLFDEYLKTVSQIEIDLRFWKYFLSAAIKKYKLENPDGWINQTGFSLYNIQPDGLNTWLHSSKETFTIEIEDLDIHSDNFFTWIMNLSIIRVYNSMELLLLKAIQCKYFPSLKLSSNKKETHKLVTEIRKYLSLNALSDDTKNNRHLIELVKNKSADFKSFLNLPVSSDRKTKWSDFYEFFSILRNIITHDAMLISQDNRNLVNSIAKDIFNDYFIQRHDKGVAEILKPKNEHDFLNFIYRINDLTANCIKFIADEKDFIFIGLHKV